MSNTRLIHLRGKPIGSGALPLICTPLVGANAAAIRAELDAVLPKRPDVIEWRVDFFANVGDTDAVIATARDIARVARDIPVLFTRRSTAEGGTPIPIDEPAVVQMYEAVCEARCVDLVDYETAKPAQDFARVRSAAQAAGIPVVASYHNFDRTPDRAFLLEKFALAEQVGGDVAKVAVMPRTADDVLTLLGATSAARESLRIPLISMSMGAVGSLSRMVGWVYGSTMTFAVGKSSSAPGQIPIEELRAVLGTVRKAVTGQ